MQNKQANNNKNVDEKKKHNKYEKQTRMNVRGRKKLPRQRNFQE